jgi:hypothetical protein
LFITATQRWVEGQEIDWICSPEISWFGQVFEFGQGPSPTKTGSHAAEPPVGSVEEAIMLLVPLATHSELDGQETLRM